MSSELLIAVLVAGIVVLTPLADRLRVPFPVLLTVFGLAVPLIPGVPHLSVEPDLILPLVLPPLLFAATQRATAREFRENARPILLLAVGLTLASAAAVAVLAHAAGMPWGVAAVLGAVVAPPDPVAATAVARRLRLPGRLVTILEGEGMFNDATALVLYNVAVAAVVAGAVTAGELGLSLVLAVGVGVGLGLAAAVLTRFALARLHAAAAETTVTIAVPFAVYLGAEQLHGSGVLAVLTLGLYLRTYAHHSLTSEGWLLGRAVWRYLDYLITSTVFVFIGFELTEILGTSPDRTSALALAGWTCVVLIAVRFAWVLGATALFRRRRGVPVAVPVGGRESVVTSWAGMRGVVTVATALAIPAATSTGEPFPGRDSVIVIALVTVLVTLVLQGLTLAPLVKRLHVGSAADGDDQRRTLRRRATGAVLDALDGATGAAYPDRVRHAVRLQYEGYLAAQEAIGTARRGSTHDDSDTGDDDAVGALLRAVSGVERAVVLDARARGDVTPEVADDLLDEVERRALRQLE
ncbi:Na+/H+ antiporter [Cellulomonas xylanilytica]|uniref:Na+/H+ antiporter n=1 Tax=Cellulomonas xylanilytica TaxID=233583 RepID=A0A510V2A1_9CELL|nr:Na+/H+ antiporter [Cellulomonas xylanilytica]GEK21014.1 Na+/H+ antiporter [Cellulomonas xylanilytica]